jgi:hypothetical protein
VSRYDAQDAPHGRLTRDPIRIDLLNREVRLSLVRQLSRSESSSGPVGTRAAPLARISLVIGMGATASLGCSSRSSAAGDMYVVEVFGTRDALTTYELTAGDMPANAPLTFVRNQFMRRFQAPRSLKSTGEGIAVASWSGGKPISETYLTPFVCDHWTQYHSRSAQGWSAVETHQLLLSEDGTLKRDTDLDRMLSYTCSVQSADGSDGDALSSLQSRDIACNETGRSAVDVQLTNGVSADAVADRPDACQGIFAQRGDGAVILTLEYRLDAHRRMNAQLAHCLRNQSLPLSLRVGQEVPDPGCPYDVHLVVSEEASQWTPKVLRPISGSWTLASFDNRDGGRVAAQVDMSFQSEQGDGQQFKLVGTMDLPLLRIPVERKP